MKSCIFPPILAAFSSCGVLDVQIFFSIFLHKSGLYLNLPEPLLLHPMTLSYFSSFSALRGCFSGFPSCVELLSNNFTKFNIKKCDFVDCAPTVALEHSTGLPRTVCPSTTIRSAPPAARPQAPSPGPSTSPILPPAPAMTRPLAARNYLLTVLDWPELALNASGVGSYIKICTLDRIRHFA